MKDQDMFDYKYILDCIDKNELLNNLSDYKVKSHIPSTFEAYNPLEVLLGNLKWSEVPKKVVGESVSDIEDDVGEELRKSFEADYRHHKVKGQPYCKKEQIQIVEWIIKYNAFKSLGGNSVWQRMEEARVGRGRSWQSLKEHFKKVVIGQIHTFGLTQAVKDKFKVGMGKMEEVPTSEMDYETPEEVESRIIPVAGIRPLRSRRVAASISSSTLNRSISSSPSTPSNDRILRPTRGKVKGSKVPADKFDQTGTSSLDSDGPAPPPPMNRRSTVDKETETSGADTRYKDKDHLPRTRSFQSLTNHSKKSNYQTAVVSSSSLQNLSPRKLLVDVGKDSELEQLLDQTVLPPHLGDKFPSDGSSEDELMKLPGKKRKLFSDEYCDSPAEEEDMFALTPVKRKSKINNKLELTKEMPSTDEFLSGLREAASIDISREDSVGGVTSTQKGLDISEENNVQPVVIEDVFDNDELELNLVISESGVSSIREGDVAKSSTPLHSLNLLDPDPFFNPAFIPDLNNCTLLECVTDLEQLPVIQSDVLVQEEVFSIPIVEPVDTQGLVDAFNNIGKDMPGIRPSSRLSVLTPSSTPPTTANDAEVVNSSFPDEVTDNPPQDNEFNEIFDNDEIIDNSTKVGQVIDIQPQSESLPNTEQVPRPLPILKKSAASAQTSKKVLANHNVEPSTVPNDVFDFSDHEGAQINDVPCPPRGRKVKTHFRYQKSGPYWNSLKKKGDSGGKSQGGTNKSVEAHVGLTKGGEALLVISGLPSDVDSEDIELVRTGQGRRRAEVAVSCDTSNENSESANEGLNGDNEDIVVRRVRDKPMSNRTRNSVENPLPGPSRERRVDEGVQKSKVKLKIVSVGKENVVVSNNKAGRFQKDGEFFDKFRLPYTKGEEEALVRYFQEMGGFKLRKGNRVWKLMENKDICPGRTWQSMKQRWDKFISKSLDKFKITVEELEEIDVQEGSENGDDDTDLNSSTVSLRGFRANANYYTTADDEKILNYIITNKRFSDVGGRAMWEVGFLVILNFPIILLF